eukprot:TRINITY_DN3937_c0_g1_i1.p1 TRINITY_DN3937_c0_g1~~TRINITY_DN3937_c0_g1_i1.p1  ORF type:complete len:269 (-),score=59.26 TRINITY_DN3937_c0_g1_i1:295-1101(-)
MMMIAVNEKGLLTEWSDEFAQLTGFRKREVLGWPFMDFVTYPFRELVQDMMASARNGVADVSVEIPFFSKAGDSVKILLSASCCDKDSAFAGHLDLACRLADEAEPADVASVAGAQGEQSLEVEGQPVSPSVLATIDEQGCIADWSEQAEEMTLFYRDELIGLCFLDLITTPFHEAVAQMLGQAARAEAVRPLEIPFYTKAAEKLDVVLSAYGDSGNVIIECQFVGSEFADAFQGENALPTKDNAGILDCDTCDTLSPHMDPEGVSAL